MHHRRKEWLISHYHTGFLWAPHVEESWNTWCCDCIQRSGLHADGYDCVEEWMFEIHDGPQFSSIVSDQGSKTLKFQSTDLSRERRYHLWWGDGETSPIFCQCPMWSSGNALRWCWGCDDWLEWWNCISWEDEWSRFQCSWCCTDYMGVIQEDC